jgi:hypothetical protein
MIKHLNRYLALVSLMTASATYGADYLIGGLETTTLTRIVPDKIIFPFTNGLASLGNWEPYASVLGTSTFLIAANTFVDGTIDLQRMRVAFQPAAGGPNKEGDIFFADDGTPFTTKVNASRQDGNPGRVAGDTRPGAVNFITGAEASPHVYVTGPHSFGSDNRWNLGLVRDASDPGGNRFGTVQTFALNPSTLAQTMLSKAQDSAYGRDTSGDVTTFQQYSRFGGELVALDNGNFVSVVEDRSLILSGGGNAATVTIFKPDGTVVKERFMAALGDLWSNVAPFKGGFCVRVSGILHFFDNAGTEIGTGVDQSTAVDNFDGSVLFTDRGRGDDSRIAGHINSPYVFMTQKRGTDVFLAAWDSRLVATESGFVAEINVNELEPAAGGTDTSTFAATTVARVNLAVDALNRVTVASEVTLAPPNPAYFSSQVAVRVLKLDDSVTPKRFTYLSHSFLAFANASTNANNTAKSWCPTVAMTTKQICIAAKGEINSTNNPSAAADTPTESNFYTVFSHPDPKEDSTAPAFPTLSITRSVGNVILSWTTNATGYTLRSKGNLSAATWQTNSPAPVTSGTVFTVTDPIGPTNKFYQLIK